MKMSVRNAIILLMIFLSGSSFILFHRFASNYVQVGKYDTLEDKAAAYRPDILVTEPKFLKWKDVVYMLERGRQEYDLYDGVSWDGKTFLLQEAQQNVYPSYPTQTSDNFKPVKITINCLDKSDDTYSQIDYWRIIKIPSALFSEPLWVNGHFYEVLDQYGITDSLYYDVQYNPATKELVGLQTELDTERPLIIKAFMQLGFELNM